MEQSLSNDLSKLCAKPGPEVLKLMPASERSFNQGPPCGSSQSDKPMGSTVACPVLRFEHCLAVESTRDACRPAECSQQALVSGNRQQLWAFPLDYRRRGLARSP